MISKEEFDGTCFFSNLDFGPLSGEGNVTSGVGLTLFQGYFIFPVSPFLQALQNNLNMVVFVILAILIFPPLKIFNFMGTFRKKIN